MSHGEIFPEYIGPYRLSQTSFNSGSYGKLALATHVASGEQVCVKYVPNDIWDDSERVCLGSISHPNVIGLKSYHRIGASHYLITQFAEGGDLFDYLDGKDRLGEDECRLFMAQLVEALQYTHECGIIHRDLKLENIFLDRSRRHVYIGDWGFATFFSHHRRLTESCGTLYYMAPELVAHRSYLGPEVDVWSLGIVLYYLAVGSLPFDHDDSSVTERMILQCKPHIPSYLSASLRHLLAGLLTPSRKRLTLAQVAVHPWFQSPTSFNPKLLAIASAASMAHEKQNKPKRALSSDDSSDDEAKRQRRVYKCRRCGQPKRGHTCALNNENILSFAAGMEAAVAASSISSPLCLPIQPLSSSVNAALNHFSSPQMLVFAT